MLICSYQADGKALPINQPPPDRDETGTTNPEKLTAGMMAMMAAANVAATCVRVKAEISRPKPVVARI